MRIAVICYVRAADPDISLPDGKTHILVRNARHLSNPEIDSCTVEGNQRRIALDRYVSGACRDVERHHTRFERPAPIKRDHLYRYLSSRVLPRRTLVA